MDLKATYFSAINALLYLVQFTRPDIVFAVNLLAGCGSAPIRRYWNGIKHILRYLHRTSDLGLFYSKYDNPSNLIGYVDAGYISDLHKTLSQTSYVFIYNGTMISWRFVKQTLVDTSSNHAEILTLHETNQECIWLRFVIEHIKSSCDVHRQMNQSTVIYKGNAACIAQVRGEYLKGDRTKYISQVLLHS